jgi:ABC-type phosphate transport system substrate-binding protein
VRRFLPLQVFLVLVALVAAGAVLNKSQSAHAAQPVVLTAAGSDTTEGVMDAILDTANSATNHQYNVHAQQSPALTVPADDNCPSVTYVDAGTSPNFASPKGSSAGRRALRDSVNGSFPNATIGATNRSCVDIARSSADRNVPGGTDNLAPESEYYAYALDIVNWASPSLNAPASLTLQQLYDIYTCKVTQWNELPGGGTGQIQRVLAQTNSGTEASFLARVIGHSETEATLNAKPVTDPTPGAVCPTIIQVEENHGNYLTIPAQGGNATLYQQMIMPYSSGKWVFQATNAANPTLDIRNGVRVGAVTTIPTDATSAAYAVRWSGSRFFLNNNGTARAVIAADGVTTSGSTTLTSATAAFKAADVGVSISGTGIPASTTIAGFTNGTTVTLSNAATSSNTGVTLTISALIASETNPNITDPSETRVFAGVRYLYNVLDNVSINYNEARAAVGFDITGSTKSPLCTGANNTDILSAGFLDLPAKTQGANPAVTCRLVP